MRMVGALYPWRCDRRDFRGRGAKSLFLFFYNSYLSLDHYKYYMVNVKHIIFL